MAALLGVVTGCSLLPADQIPIGCRPPPGAREPAVTRDFPELSGMTPDEVLVALADEDVEISWRYSYDTEPPNIGFSECWCVPPPDGTVMGASTGVAGEVIVSIEAPGPILGGRPQPERGWGC
jgi:hypothetical protein